MSKEKEGTRPSPVALEVYKHSFLGKSLTKTIFQYVENGLLDPFQARQILQTFGIYMYETMENKFKDKNINIIINGNIARYNLYDRIWKIELKDPEIKKGNLRRVVKGLLRIIATPNTKQSEKQESISLDPILSDFEGAGFGGYGELVGDVPIDKRFRKMTERRMAQNNPDSLGESSAADGSIKKSAKRRKV